MRKENGAKRTIVETMGASVNGHRNRGKSSGGYEQRRAGREADGKLAWCEFGDITRLREDFLIYMERRKGYKCSSHESKNGGKKGRKEKEARKVRKIKEEGEIIAPMFDFRKLELAPLEVKRLLRAKNGDFGRK